MEGLRRRIDEIVDDPETAERLKPWYGKACKRVCFHDEYLPSFNRPNVHLVDTDGRGVDRITKTGVGVGDTEYPVDVLIFASGFEITTDYHQRLGFDPKGRDGVRLSEYWSDGARTMHGVFSAGFPNMMMMGLTQASFGTNFVHFLTKGAEHIASIIAECKRQGIVAFEPTPEGEDGWLMTLYGAPPPLNPRYSRPSTPAYHTTN